MSVGFRHGRVRQGSGVCLFNGNNNGNGGWCGRLEERLGSVARLEGLEVAGAVPSSTGG